MEFGGSGEGHREKIYLMLLLGAAREYIGSSRFNSVVYFYRNKPEEYFREVLRNNNVLPKILKDKSGDQLSPINRRLSGVFLGVSLFHGQLPWASPFGDVRVQFPIEAVFNQTTNLYFTDFYCITPSCHYVTLVLTKRWSREDNFCKQHLIELDVHDNPFLRMPDGYERSAYSTIGKSALLVEVFYTEEIHLGHIERSHGRVQFSRTGVIGKGTSTWGGLRKNRYCEICNPILNKGCDEDRAFRQPRLESRYSLKKSNQLFYTSGGFECNEFENGRDDEPEDNPDDEQAEGSKKDMLMYLFLFVLIAAVVFDWYKKGRVRPW